MDESFTLYEFISFESSELYIKPFDRSIMDYIGEDTVVDTSIDESTVTTEDD